MPSPKKRPIKRVAKDDFESVAKRLGCDEDMATFEKKLGKIARTKPAATPPPKGQRRT